MNRNGRPLCIKIRVNPQLSQEVQERAIQKDFTWQYNVPGMVENIDKPFLYLDSNNNRITYGIYYHEGYDTPDHCFKKGRGTEVETIEEVQEWLDGLPAQAS